jgi:hypothetical protein
MLALFFYFRSNKILFAIVMTALLLTKESGVVLGATLIFIECLKLQRNKNLRDFINNLSFIFLPFVIAGSYFIVQRIQFGWFLFPYHLGFISFGVEVWSEKLPAAFSYLFIYWGRNSISLFVILACLFLLFKKEKFNLPEKNILLTCGVYIVLYLVFSAINFFIPRYLIAIFPPMLISAAFLLDKAFSRFKFLLPSVVSIAAATCIYFTFFGRKSELAYRDSVVCHRQVVEFCEKTNLRDSYIFTHFIMRVDLSEPVAGYLSGQKFTNVQYELDGKTQYWIVSSDELDHDQYERLKKSAVLLKRFEYGKAWSELYRIR